MTMADPQPSATRAFSEDDRNHFGLIQQTIARMASASATAKGWLLPVITAAYGYALSSRSVPVALLGAGAALLFGTLDAQYLRQERAFRALYRAAVRGHVQTYEMNNARYYSKPDRDAADEREESCRWIRVLWSWSITGFYLPLILVGIFITIRSAA